MLKKTMGWILLWMICVGAATVEAQTEERGFIIRVMEKDRLLYIDMGRRDGVQIGDVFDILAPDVLRNPLSGDTLEVLPTRVGALRVRQVFEKMSVAELVHLEAGQDPMMKRIAPVQDAERMSQIEQYLQRPRFGGTAGGAARWSLLLPGWPQWRGGQRLKGGAMMVTEAAALATAIGYRLSSNDWKDQYDRLPAGLPASDYEYYYEEANDRRSRSNQLFWIAGAVFAYHCMDLLWLTDHRLMASGERERGAGLSMGWMGDGCTPGLLLRRVF